MVKDRTFEFRSTIDTISSGTFPQIGAHNSMKSSRNNQFLDKATNISQEFVKISSKLEQLSRRKVQFDLNATYFCSFVFVVAKNKSIFDDKPEEFEELSNIIKRELSNLNRRIQELKNTPTIQSTTSSNKTILEHERNVILILQNWTAQSFKSFENILEIRSQVQKRGF